MSGGSALDDFAVRAEVVYNLQDYKPKTIYWNYHEEVANVKWIDNETVFINGHKLNIHKDTFDFRRTFQKENWNKLIGLFRDE